MKAGPASSLMLTLWFHTVFPLQSTPSFTLKHSGPGHPQSPGPESDILQSGFQMWCVSWAPLINVSLALWPHWTWWGQALAGRDPKTGHDRDINQTPPPIDVAAAALFTRLSVFAFLPEPMRGSVLLRRQDWKSMTSKEKEGKKNVLWGK